MTESERLKRTCPYHLVNIVGILGLFGISKLFDLTTELGPSAIPVSVGMFVLALVVDLGSTAVLLGRDGGMEGNPTLPARPTIRDFVSFEQALFHLSVLTLSAINPDAGIAFSSVRFGVAANNLVIAFRHLN